MNTLQKLPTCLSLVLSTLAIAGPVSAQQNAAEQPDKKQADQKETEQKPEAGRSQENTAEALQEIVITGSLIPHTENTGMSPVTVVSSEEMAEKGLTSIGAVMDSLTENSGYTEGKASNLLGRFTTGGQEVNIRGFGTGRTLILVNGRRVADYPLPFGGEENGVDVGAIPMSAVARIELLSSGASAIYGSDAVGGVLNFITKRDMDQTEASISTGTFQQGVGKSLMGSFITGNSFEHGSFTVGLDAFTNEQILASDVDHLKKHAPYNANMVAIQRNTPPAQIVSIVPPEACAQLGFDFVEDSCSGEVSHTISLQPEVRQVSGFFDGRYDLTDNVELFGTGLFTDNQYDTRSNVLFWNGVVVKDDQSSAVFLTRGFSDDELGSSNVGAKQRMWTATVGARGGFDVRDDQWHWDLAYSHARYNTTETTINLKEEGIRDWILRGASSVVPDDMQRYTYFVDSNFYDNQLVNNIVTPVQASDVDGLIGKNVMRATASSSFLTLTLNGTFGDLGFAYKPVKFALRSEFAKQSTEIIPDERSLNTTGEGWYNIGAITSKGDRDRKALALELEIPLLSKLDVSLAGRVDHYDDASSISGRASAQLKFLYRVNDQLKIRGGYSQTFRAPDMFNIYGESDAFESVADFSAPGCFDGQNYVCGFDSVATTRSPDPGLTEEHGDDYGIGLIWQPMTNLGVTADWYRIELKDLVVTESAYDMLLKEWQCDHGVLDSASHLCADIHSRITRNGFGAVEHVTVQPINQNSMEREGLDLRANFTYESEKLGSFDASLSYSKVLKFRMNRFAGDAPIDLKYGWIGQSTPENSMGLTLGWSNPLTTGKAVGATLFIQRDGGVYNFSQTQLMEPLYSVNLTASYQFNAKTAASLTLDNLLYTKPQDNGSGIWPYYWAHLQNPSALGRAAYVSLHHSFN